MLGIDGVQPLPHLQYLLGVDGDVGRLPGGAPGRLVDHDPGVGEGAALARGAGGEEEGAHGGGLADAEGGDGGADVLHGVVDGEAGGDGAAGGVDVEGEGLGGVLRLEEEELGHDHGGRVVGDGAVDADHALLEEPGEDVVGALASGGVLDHHRDQAVGAGEGGGGGGGGANAGEDG